MKKNNKRIEKPRLAAVPEEIATISFRSFQSEPCESEIREYAYHLFEHSNQTSSNDLDNWFEARARLVARIPVDRECGRINVQRDELVEHCY